MRLKLWIVTLSSLVLVAGCETPTGDFADIAKPIVFSSEETVDWLAENDESLLRQIVAHNELVETFP